VKRQDGELSPRERIETALKLHHLESPGSPISIAAICAQAGVNRANLYERHRDLIEIIRGSPKTANTKRETATATIADLKEKLAAERKKASALYYCCVELQAEVRRLRARAALDAGGTARRRTRQPKGE
jgi:hypothetical protein